MEVNPSHRHRVLLFLRLFSSTEAVEKYIGEDDPESVGTYLIRLWIEDLYVPGLRYLDGLKGDRDLALVEAFESCFDPHERFLLEQFHRFLELRLEMLPKRRAHETVFPRGEFWQHIIAHAGRVIEEIDPEGIEMDELIERSVMQLGRRS